MTDIARTYREAYDKLVANKDGVLGIDRPALFSPAIAAQERSTASTYFYWTPLFIPYEYTNWRDEAAAHTTTCYIGDWTSIGKLSVTGPDAYKFFSQVGVNDLSRLEVGQIVHHVQVDNEGRLASEGVLYRVEDDVFFYSGGGVDWTAWQFSNGNWDAVARDISAEHFIFEVQGPKSLEVLERLFGSEVRAVSFNRARTVEIDGNTIRLLRTGISGELGYELHGRADLAALVWERVVEAGADSGIKQLGMGAQLVAHIEAGIATAGIDYLPTSIITPGGPKLVPNGAPGGSFIPFNGVGDYFRYPSELGWGRRPSLETHDFIGRDALRELSSQGGTGRRLLSLEWNEHDVKSILTSAYDEVPAEPMLLPRQVGMSMDRIIKNGQDIGVSSSRTFSVHLTKTISLALLPEGVEIGEDVAVVWGAPGTAQREVRATVRPIAQKRDRRRADTTQI